MKPGESAKTGQGGQLSVALAIHLQAGNVLECFHDRLQRYMQAAGGHVRADELDDGGGHASEPARRTG